MFNINRTNTRFKVTTKTLGELSCLVTTATWKALTEQANTEIYDQSPKSFITYVLDKIIEEKAEKPPLQKLTSDELEACKNDIFNSSKSYLLDRQKILGNDSYEVKDNVSFEDFLKLIKDIKLANYKETRERFELISSAETLSIADKIDALAHNISSSEPSYLDQAPLHTPILEPTLPLENIEEVLQEHTNLLMSSQSDANRKHGIDFKWNLAFFSVSIISVVVSIYFSNLANNSSNKTDHILSNQQTLVIKQNELLSKILESQVTTNNQIRLLVSNNHTDVNNETISTLKSIENLLITNNSLLDKKQKEAKTND